MKISLIPQEAITKMWPHVRKQLGRAIGQSKGRHTMASTRKWLVEGRYLLWVIAEDRFDQPCASAVTGVVHYPAKRVLTVILMGGGRMDDWAADFNDTLYRLARELGVDEIELTGRKGWRRIGRKFGWTEPMAFLSRDVK